MEDINEIHNNIMGRLDKGPAMVLEIAESIEKDTLQAQTIVDYFVSRGEIRKTQRKFGSSPVYFLEKDHEKALEILMQTLNSQEKTLIAKVRESKVINLDSLSSAERYLSQNLTDFIKKVSAQDNQTGEKSDYIYEQSLSLDDVKNIINKKGSDTGNENKPKLQKRLENISKASPPVSMTDLLGRNGFKNPKNIEKNVFLCDYGKNDTKVIVQILKKKIINKKDFINAMGYGSAYKTITFIITDAQKIANGKSFGSMVNIISDVL
jgi:hypothetical protein